MHMRTQFTLLLTVVAIVVYFKITRKDKEKILTNTKIYHLYVIMKTRNIVVA